MPFISIAFMVALILETARTLDPGEQIISPDRRFTVVATSSIEGEQEVTSYAIRARATGRTLGICPKDARISSRAGRVLWSPDSRHVAISTHTQRHGDLPDLWAVTSRKGTILPVDFSKEDYDIYVTPKRWLNAATLQCDVFGRTNSEHRKLHPNEPFIGYSLKIRIDPKSRQTRVFRTKPETPDQSVEPE